MQIDDLQRELSHRVGDQASQLALRDVRVQELERTTAGASERALRLEEQLEEARRLAEERLRALEERDAEIARLAVQQQAPPAIGLAAEVAELKRQLEAAQEV